MTLKSRVVAGLLAGISLVAVVGCNADGLLSSSQSGNGTLVVQLTDAPFPLDSVRSADIFVVRIDGKQQDADSAEASRDTGDGENDHGGWTLLAEPKAKIDLLALRDGKASTLGQKALPPGSYRSFRLIIDPAQSSVTLKDGTVLTSTSNPGIKFPSADRSGIKIQLDREVTIGKDSTKTLVVDFDLSRSFEMRGPAMKNGLTFKPEIKATSK
jgi:hypothetical protein